MWDLSLGVGFKLIYIVERPANMAMFVVSTCLLVDNASPTGGSASPHPPVEQDLKKLQAENEDQPCLSSVLELRPGLGSSDTFVL